MRRAEGPTFAPLKADAEGIRRAICRELRRRACWDLGANVALPRRTVEPNCFGTHWTVGFDGGLSADREHLVRNVVCLIMVRYELAGT